MSTTRTTLLTIFTSALTTAVVCVLVLGVGRPQAQSLPPLVNNPPISSQGFTSSANEEATVQTVQHADPAVASVIISKDVPVMEQYMEQVDPFGNGSMFQIPRTRQNGTEKKEIGGGTAFFVNSNGLLLTNKHVVDDEKAEYTVLLNDGRKLPAKVAAIDPVNDIALLKVEGSNFPFLMLSSKDEPDLGQTAIAIGNALGEYRNTVSVGVVSGLGRSITAGDQTGQTEQLTRIIQTDAAINRGNSGGPLLATDGTVMGMNTATAGGAQNISFAIPAGDLRRVVESYQKNGKIVRPYLGVRYAPITEEMRTKNKLNYDYGVIVVRGDTNEDLAVVPGSPADKAGIAENDIILEADGKKLTELNPLSAVIQRKQPGDTLTLKVVHQGKEKTVTVTLEEWKDK
jgi:serine protease Do